jgi:hypothetical protein
MLMRKTFAAFLEVWSETDPGLHTDWIIDWRWLGE